MTRNQISTTGRISMGLGCFTTRFAIGAIASAACVTIGLAATVGASDSPAIAASEATMDSYVLDHAADRITGEPEDLGEVYAGEVILIVNVASRCGYTKQYSELEELYRAHKDDGFVILGFPANDFGAQEPGSDDEILEFCSSKFDVTFPMFAKITVTGDEAHPLYMDLREQPDPIGGAPKWNFTKFLVNREGEVIARFEPAEAPMGDKLRSAVEAAVSGSFEAPAEPGQ